MGSPRGAGAKVSWGATVFIALLTVVFFVVGIGALVLLGPVVMDIVHGHGGRVIGPAKRIPSWLAAPVLLLGALVSLQYGLENLRWLLTAKREPTRPPGRARRRYRRGR